MANRKKKFTNQNQWLREKELWKSQCNNTDNNYTDYSDTDPFLSLSIRNGKEMIRCYITDDEAAVCLYCRISFSLFHIEMWLMSIKNK